jgi:hypothetical protein
MLFEIFFDPGGKLRPETKGRHFNESFRSMDLRGGFECISEALVAALGDFYAVPAQFEEQLSQEPLVPKQLLTLTYTPREAGSESLQVPCGHRPPA